MSTPRMSISEARARTEEIRAALAGGTDDDVNELIRAAVRDGVDRALGHADLAEFAATELGRAAAGDIPRRRRLVRALAEQGLSTRAIGLILGTSQSTAARDARFGGGTIRTPVTGLDAKIYPRPAPTPPVEARSLGPLRVPEAAYHVAVQRLQRDVKQLSRVHADEHVTKIRPRLRGHARGLRAAARQLVDMADDLEGGLGRRDRRLRRAS